MQRWKNSIRIMLFMLMFLSLERNVLMILAEETKESKISHISDEIFDGL